MNTLQKMFTIEQVVEITGLSRTSIWRHVKTDKFPAPVKLGEHRTMWLESDLIEWQEQLERATY
jgi:prophage regulatory protein